eukprot:CAMPEP_0198271816 /NCGR_PEP_ID=MMETSP1447-20131203/50671_1 /TAXON_ID=420782 /ORGANISM="Chaetoceros dichaeta, Strain CCMP1751" /LENGTH=50 /DNA_ID=CAMNT_0043964625 /DNA_START=130 /DNA_END=282 /DNA_ORIENTATION=+
MSLLEIWDKIPGLAKIFLVVVVGIQGFAVLMWLRYLRLEIQESQIKKKFE